MRSREIDPQIFFHDHGVSDLPKSLWFLFLFFFLDKSPYANNLSNWSSTTAAEMWKVNLSQDGALSSTCFHTFGL